MAGAAPAWPPAPPGRGTRHEARCAAGAALPAGPWAPGGAGGRRAQRGGTRPVSAQHGERGAAEAARAAGCGSRRSTARRDLPLLALGRPRRGAALPCRSPRGRPSGTPTFVGSAAGHEGKREWGRVAGRASVVPRALAGSSPRACEYFFTVDLGAHPRLCRPRVPTAAAVRPATRFNHTQKETRPVDEQARRPRPAVDRLAGRSPTAIGRPLYSPLLVAVGRPLAPREAGLPPRPRPPLPRPPPTWKERTPRRAPPAATPAACGCPAPRGASPQVHEARAMLIVPAHGGCGSVLPSASCGRPRHAARGSGRTATRQNSKSKPEL